MIEDVAESDHFISYAQNGEDVVLWRALCDVREGRYVDVGAADPIEFSVTRAFCQRGWSGIDVEPVHEFAEALRADRPRNTVLECLIGDSEGDVTFYEFPETGLSTADPAEAEHARDLGYSQVERTVPMRSLNAILKENFKSQEDFHFLKVDVEGFEEFVLAGIDLAEWRPWVVVVEATRPLSTELTFDRWEHLLTGAGYTRTLFEGLNAFYVSPDHLELLPLLSYPACPLDVYTRFEQHVVTTNLASERLESQKWKDQWAQAQARLIAGQQALKRTEVSLSKANTSLKRSRATSRKLKASTSWQLTKPLRLMGRIAKSKSKPTSVGSATSPHSSAPSAGAHAKSTNTKVLLHEVTRKRLLEVTRALGRTDDPDTTTMILLEHIADLLEQAENVDPLLWLLFIAFYSKYPSEDDFRAVRTQFDLDGAANTLATLATDGPAQPETWAKSAQIKIVETPMILVTHTAKNDLHTGIQRVVRETVRRWAAKHSVELVGFDSKAGVYRELDAVERRRVLNWGEEPVSAEPGTESADHRSIVIPWGATIVIPELVGTPKETAAIVATCRHARSELVAILYDLIPYTFPEACAHEMHAAFAAYMRVIRYAQRISTISASVADDLRGFANSSKGLGLSPPSVRAQLLPVHAHEVSTAEINQARAALVGVPGIPMVLSVSSIEPRKNQITILTAAERLWREGQAFQLVFIAGSGWKREVFDQQLNRAKDRGRPVQVISEASESTLWAAYHLARFSVFVSFTEGFGLPAAESIAAGTPVVLSNYGSMLEIGAAGGAELVDPRSVDSVTDAMRLLLTDSSHLEKLAREATQRQEKTWDEYSDETWAWLVERQ